VISNRGALVQPAFEWQGQRLAPNICYENLFGEELAPNFLESALAPTIFVNVSNLAWFGDGVALDQHLQISRMRALEFARPFALATNTGVTAIVDHQGRVVSSLPRAGRAVLVSEIEGRSGVTPYAWWVARMGLWPWWLLAIGVLGGGGASWPTKRSVKRPGDGCRELSRAGTSNPRKIRVWHGNPVCSPTQGAEPHSSTFMLTFQQIIFKLQSYWDAQGCALLQPYDMEVGAGTSHTATFLRAIGP
jgi:hypothetical protein